MYVTINGVAQLHGVDYVLGVNQISFTQAPPFASTITIRLKNNTIHNITGDGCTFLFPILSGEDDELADMLADVIKYHKVPAIAEALEKLKVIIELVKQ